MKLCHLIAIFSVSLALSTGCDSKKSDGGDKKDTKEEEKPAKKSLQEREDALFAQFMKLGGTHKDDCNKMGAEMKALVTKESETVDEINKTFEKMTAEQKEEKKKASQARQNKYDQGLSVIVCSVSNADVKDAGDKIVPATK